MGAKGFDSLRFEEIVNLTKQKQKIIVYNLAFDNKT